MRPTVTFERILRILAVVLSAAFFHGASSAQPPTKDTTSIELETVFRGAIEDDDPVVSTKQLSRTAVGEVRGETCLFEITEAGTYSVELRSSYFDAYLVVRDAAGKVLAESNDGLIAPDAGVVLRDAQAGVYRITACAQGGQRGPFALLVKPGASAGVDPADLQRAEIDNAAARVRFVEEAHGPESHWLVESLNWQALIYQRWARHAEAVPVLARALAVAEKAFGPDHSRTADCLNSLGKLLWSLQDHARAKPLMQRALSIIETNDGADHARAAVPLTNLAMLLNMQGRFQEARPFAERALAIHRREHGPEHGITAFGLNALASVHEGNLEYAEALPLIEKVVAIWQQNLGPRHPLTFEARVRLAGVWSALGKYDEAARVLEGILAMKGVLSSGQPSIVAAHHTLAVVRLQQGRFEEARELVETTLAIQERTLGKRHPMIAGSLGALSRVHEMLGDHATARSLNERALAILEATLGPNHPATARSLNNLAINVGKAGEFAQARSLLERAISINETHFGPEHGRTRTCLVSLAYMHVGEGNHAEAARICEQVVAINNKVLGPDHPDSTFALNNLASALQSMGEFGDARPVFEKALAIREKTLAPDHPDVILSTSNLTQVLIAMNLAEEAWTLARKAVIASESRLRRVVWSLTEAERFQFAKEQYRALQLLLSTARILSSNDAERESYEVVLRWKGQISRSLMQRRAALRPSDAADQADTIAELRRLQATLSQLFFDSDGQDPASRDAALSRLRARRAQLEREILSHARSSAAAETVRVAQLAAALPADSVLVDFLVHPVLMPAPRRDDGTFEGPLRWMPPRVTAWILRPGKADVTRVDLGDARPIAAAIRAFLEGLVRSRGVGLSDGADGAGGADPASDLRSLLWDPLAAELGDAAKVFVSPDAFLGTLPFEVLQRRDGSYLIEHHAFVYLQDMTALVRIASDTSAREGRPGTLLSVGSVDYRKTDDLVWRASDGDGPADRESEGTAETPTARVAMRGSFTDYWGKLPATALESEVVVDLHEDAFDDKAARLLLQGNAASEERIKHELPRHRVVHLATHGFFQPEGLPSMWEQVRGERGMQMRMREEDQRITGMLPGLLSGLVLAGANREPAPGRDDGLLTAEELSFLDLTGVDLVVLSACDTGLGRSESGEGMLGLRRTLRQAGVRTVISSLWSVRDDSTSRLMRSFYKRHWLDGKSRLDALRDAQLDMLKRNRIENDGEGLPSTWGAFVLDGSWR